MTTFEILMGKKSHPNEWTRQRHAPAVLSLDVHFRQGAHNARDFIFPTKETR
jgi:hypothetical protein